MGAEAGVIHDALVLTAGAGAWGFGILPGGQFLSGLREVVFESLPEKFQYSQGLRSHLRLEGVDQNKSDLVVVCQGVCSVVLLLQGKKKSQNSGLK